MPGNPRDGPKWLPPPLLPGVGDKKRINLNFRIILSALYKQQSLCESGSRPMFLPPLTSDTYQQKHSRHFLNQKV